MKQLRLATLVAMQTVKQPVNSKTMTKTGINVHQYSCNCMDPYFITFYNPYSTVNFLIFAYLLILIYCFTAQVPKVCRTFGPTARSKTKMLHKVCLKEIPNLHPSDLHSNIYRSLPGGQVIYVCIMTIITDESCSTYQIKGKRHQVLHCVG